MQKTAGARGEHQRTHVAPQDEVVDDGHDAAHGVGQLIMVVAGAVEVDAPAIAQQASGQELVVDVQRGCAQVFGVDHCEGVVGAVVITPPSHLLRGDLRYVVFERDGSSSRSRQRRYEATR